MPWIQINRSPLGDATYEQVPLESDNIRDQLDTHVSGILKQARDMTRDILLSRKTSIDKITEELIENSEVRNQNLTDDDERYLCC